MEGTGIKANSDDLEPHHHSLTHALQQKGLSWAASCSQSQIADSCPGQPSVEFTPRMQFELRKAQKSALKIRKLNKRNSHKNGKHDRYWFNTDMWLEPSSAQKFASKQLANRNTRVLPRPAVVAPRPTPIVVTGNPVTCNALRRVAAVRNQLLLEAQELQRVDVAVPVLTAVLKTFPEATVLLPGWLAKHMSTVEEGTTSVPGDLVIKLHAWLERTTELKKAKSLSSALCVIHGLCKGWHWTSATPQLATAVSAWQTRVATDREDSQHAAIEAAIEAVAINDALTILRAEEGDDPLIDEHDPEILVLFELTDREAGHSLNLDQSDIADPFDKNSEAFILHPIAPTSEQQCESLVVTVSPFLTNWRKQCLDRQVERDSVQTAHSHQLQCNIVRAKQMWKQLKQVGQTNTTKQQFAASFFIAWRQRHLDKCVEAESLQYAQEHRMWLSVRKATTTWQDQFYLWDHSRDCMQQTVQRMGSTSALSA